MWKFMLQDMLHFRVPDYQHPRPGPFSSMVSKEERWEKRLSSLQNQITGS